MPAFVTPAPLDVSIELGAGRIELHASDREDTVVDVVPGDPRNASSVEAAAATRVSHGAGRLDIVAPKRFFSFFTGESIVVRVLLPADSRVRADTTSGDVVATGRLGSSRLSTLNGDVTVDEAADLRVRATNGEVSVRRVDATLDVVSGNGTVHLGRIGGATTVKGAHGDVEVTEVAGRFDVSLASGSVHVSRSTGTLTARSAYGGVRIDELAAGSARIDTVYGKIEVAVRAGVAAWVDLAADRGTVVNDLGPSDAPAEGEPTVELRARAAWGGVKVGRTVR